MQYLLTQKEMDDLVPKERLERRDKVILVARDMILKYAKFTCVHDIKKGTAGHGYNTYCDDCPLGILKAPASAQEYLCKLSQSYSK